ncbi:MAG: peptidyl-prolyl cis-trans isomerase [Deltaproteobacteria bacterium]|nr:peptidyl-prolyl cis-trans isomerase [Deltaproteobacteria bacterium]
MNLRCKQTIKIALLIFLVTVLLSCKTEIKDETPLVMVNNEEITFAQFRNALEGFHIQNREEGKVDPLDIRGFLDKLIRNRLFIQESVRAGLDKDLEVVLTVNAEVKRQSILMLHKEEIDDKVKVTHDEAWEEYCTRLEKRRTKVEKIREEYSPDPNTQRTETKNYLSTLRKRVKLEVDPNYIPPGQEQYDPNNIAAKYNGNSITGHDLFKNKDLTEITEGTIPWKYVLWQLIDNDLLEQEIQRFSPSKDSFQRNEKSIRKDLLKEHRQEREVAYLEELRQKAKIDKPALDLDLSALFLEAKDPNQPAAVVNMESSDPNLPVALVNDEIIALAELKKGIKEEEYKQAGHKDRESMIENRLQYLIDCLLIDQEALSRGYEDRPEVKKAARAAGDKILYKKFFRKLLLPSIKLTDEEVKTYFEEHPDLFRSPIYVKVEEIRMRTKEEADEIHNEIGAGADFNFLKNRSLHKRMISRHWTPLASLSPPVEEGLAEAKEGDVIGPVSWDMGHSIFQLKRRRGGEILPFDKVKKASRDKLFRERFDETVEKWERILRASSEIVIFEDNLQIILSNVGG